MKNGIFHSPKRDAAPVPLGQNPSGTHENPRAGGVLGPATRIATLTSCQQDLRGRGTCMCWSESLRKEPAGLERPAAYAIVYTQDRTRVRKTTQVRAIRTGVKAGPGQ